MKVEMFVFVICLFNLSTDVLYSRFYNVWLSVPMAFGARKEWVLLRAGVGVNFGGYVGRCACQLLVVLSASVCTRSSFLLSVLNISHAITSSTRANTS